jgi:hypothetical protein
MVWFKKLQAQKKGQLVKMRELQPGSAEAKRRGELLAIMNDPSRSNEERDAAAIAATPLCHELPPAGIRAGGSEG